MVWDRLDLGWSVERIVDSGRKPVVFLPLQHFYWTFCIIQALLPPPYPSPLCLTAEVQLHGNPFERQEMDQLREQLISTFREQMDVRRHLMELENNYMEIQIESSRHLLTIAE